MKELFVNSAYNTAIRDDGYLVMPLLHESDILALTNIFRTYLAKNVGASDQPYDVYECTGDNDRDTNHIVNNELRKILLPYISELFRDYTYHGGSFLVRTPEHTRELPLHQDWSVIDEQVDQQIFMWMPLQKTVKENGAIFLIPGSHNFYKVIRSGSFPSKRITRSAIPAHLVKTIELEAGEVLFYQPNIFHGSYPNTSGTDRIVATSYITNRDAELIYYHKIDERTIGKYAISPDSYIEDINHLANGIVPPGAELKARLPNDHRQISKEMLLKALNVKHGHRSQLKKTISKLLSKKT